jgi:hypothetical protein
MALQAADLTDKLSAAAQFPHGGPRLEVEQWSNVSAHALRTALGRVSATGSGFRRCIGLGLARSKTYDWIMDGLRARAGFAIKGKVLHDGVVGRVLCRLRRMKRDSSQLRAELAEPFALPAHAVRPAHRGLAKLRQVLSRKVLASMAMPLPSKSFA